MEKTAAILCVIGLIITNDHHVLGARDMGGSKFLKNVRSLRLAIPFCSASYTKSFSVYSQSRQVEHSKDTFFKVFVSGKGVEDDFHLPFGGKKEYSYGNAEYALYVSDKDDIFGFAFFTDTPQLLVVVRNGNCEERKYTNAFIGKKSSKNRNMTSSECENVKQKISNKRMSFYK